MLKYDHVIDMSSENALSLILRNITPGSHVLEFGPAKGYMTRYMKEELGCTVYCVEVDQDSAEIARSFSKKMIIADLDDLNWGDHLSGELFDHIIFADVLEHLKNPWNVLHSAISFLRQNGTVLTSIPNISHNAVIMELLQGNFDYRNLGLLDDTHLRFFTKKSVLELLGRANLCPVKWMGTVLLPEQTEFEQKYHKFPESIQFLLKKNENGHVYQFVTVSKRIVDISPEERFEKLLINNEPQLNEFIQVFWDGNVAFDESRSVRIPLESGTEYPTYNIPLPAETCGQLRLDPINHPSYVAIRSVSLYAGDPNENTGLVPLARWSKDNYFEGILHGETVLRLDDPELYKLICTNEDPQILLNKIPESIEGQLLTLSIEMHVEKEISKKIVDLITTEINRRRDISDQQANELNKIQEELLRKEEQICEQIDELKVMLVELTKKEEQLNEYQKNLIGMKDELKSNEDLITELYQQIQHNGQFISILEKTVADKEKVLQSIYNSNAWKVNNIYYKTRDRIFPLRSKRRVLAKVFFKAILSPKILLKNLNKKNIKKFLRELRYSEPSLVLSKVDNKLNTLINQETKNYSNFKEIVNKENADQFKEYLRLFMKEKLNIFLNSHEALLELPKFNQPIISIVLVLYNKAEYTYQCLETIKAHADVPYEVIIVDNASSDNTAALLKKMTNAVILKNTENVGFLKACNQGAQLARGKWLLFLNNDTQITPALFSTLLQTAENTTNCGAVGAKLIFPDGKMQEAGSIIWNDGSCLGYGRGEEPFSPEFSYVKEVDFCSGACLLVKYEIFNEIGKFDELFYPAYYEETDLCMKIRELGFKVIYQPSAIVIHYEFGSSNSFSRAIELQVTNKERFINKWEYQLSNNYPSSMQNILNAREYNNKKLRVLVIEDRIPAPELGSGYPRSFKILECLAELKYGVTLFPLQDPEKIEPHTYKLQQKGVEVFFNKVQEKLNFEKFYEERKNYYNVIWISRPHNMQEIIDLIKNINPNQKIIYDAEALFSLREIMQLELNGKKLSEHVKNEMIYEEIDLMCKSDVVVTVSERERQIIANSGLKQVKVLGYPVDINVTPQKFDERKDILFIGGFLSSPSPNEDSILYFVKEIFPKVYNEIGAKLWIVGTNNLESIKNLSSENIIVTGKVDNLWEYYNKSRVFVVPTRFAAGIPLKLQECLAHGLPAVVTPLIAEQLRLNEDVLLVGNGAEDFANKIVKCYQDEKTWLNLRENGLRYIKNECNLLTFKQELEELMTANYH